MKLQKWCPNAILISGSQLSGREEAIYNGKNSTDINPAANHLEQAKKVEKLSEILSIPCIKVFETDFINPLNRKGQIADAVHPYSVKGGKNLARAIISGFKQIEPNI